MNVGALRARGVIDAIDAHFAQWLARKGAAPITQLAGALASRAVRQGHVCVDLNELGTAVLDLDGAPVEGLAWPTDWSGVPVDELVGPAGKGGTDATPAGVPLIWEAGRVYLARYFDHEQALATALAGRATPVPVDTATLEQGIQALFPCTPLDAGQRHAVRVAVGHRLAVISGGPGTGKTHTVTRLLATLGQQRRRRGLGDRVRLLAPTGKAAARLLEALDAQRSELGGTYAVGLPERASTVHRALSAIGGSRVNYRHHAGHPLPDDIVVVDEASMVDLALMRRLVDAVRLDAHLVLLGDRHQLASVESGAVLGEIARAADAAPESPIGQCVATLSHSFRFDQAGGIGALADAIRDGDVTAALGVLEEGGTVQRLDRPPPHQLGATLSPIVERGFAALLAADDPVSAVQALQRFRVLCAHRRGPWGVEGLNPLIERVLSRRGLAPAGTWYPRRPILVRSNDYRQELFNGDQGVTLPGPRGLRVWFAGDPPRGLSPSRLADVETVFALSIHKSQGSEYDHVVVMLPEVSSPLLSRELLYTAITRARQRVTIVGEPAVVAAAIQRPVRRVSGLAARLAAAAR